TNIPLAGNAGALTNLNPAQIRTGPGLPLGALASTAGSNPQCVAISGNYAYVANNGSQMLQIVDVSTPSSPQVLGSLIVAGNPIAVAVAGRYVYLLYQFSTTLDVIDVSNPSNPVSVGLVATGNLPQSIALSGRYAYVVNNGQTGTRSLMAVD